MRAPVRENPAKNPVKKYQVNEIKTGYFFTEPVYLDKQFVLTTPEMKFTGEMKKALDEWKFKEVYSAGSPTEEYTAVTTEKTESGGVSHISSYGDTGELKRAEEFYADFLQYVETLFARVEQTNKLDFNSIIEKMKTVCDTIKEDRRFILRIEQNQFSGPNENYMASHAAKSTIISIVIGLQLKMPNHRLIELGVSALLHEIGMTRLPEETYLSSRPLEIDERKAILAHPILGYNILKSSEFPMNITTPVLEHHERESGDGYPRKLTGEKISLNSKIIAVACSYEALSANRPHKKAKDGYTGMMELLKNSGHQYDDAVVRALVFSLSLYPIGLYVLLSSGRKGQVVDVNPENPRFPIVQILGELTPNGKNKTVETSQDGVYILRPLTKDETDGTGSPQD
jgi:HD-GYP domain-containing protein (c-di-GMP phosphodiesterase class II)